MSTPSWKVTPRIDLLINLLELHRKGIERLSPEKAADMITRLRLIREGVVQLEEEREAADNVIPLRRPARPAAVVVGREKEDPT